MSPTWKLVGRMSQAVSRAATQLPLSSGKGKKSAWEAWNAYVEVTEAFNNFMNHPYMTVTVNCKQFQLLERFTVIIYNKTSNLDSVNEARRELFSQKNRPMERFPQRKKPFCSTHCAQSTKLESGQPVIM
ncbi:hypothetical protein GWK47_034576 [Chionoecetes opilio]|uniref:Uncharacterized protein n=1 Tax=Chionoecetes opilio TaxID=41210 RepID=A0A8J4YI38_CHIOP|nr:hypothetical protein GWK47_034576 [Chionoecetes opilio]